MNDMQMYLSAVVGLDAGSPQFRMMTYSQERLTRVLDECPAAITVGSFGVLIPERLLELFARARSRYRAQVSHAQQHSRWRLYCRQAHESAMHFERLVAGHELTHWRMPEPGGQVAFVDAGYVFEAKQVEQFDTDFAEAVISRIERESDEPSVESLEVQNYKLLRKARAEMLQRVETYSSVELAAISQSSNVNSSAFAADLRRASKILGVRSGREWLYPRFQFDARSKPVRPFPEIKPVLAALPPDRTGWDHLQWFLDPNTLLDEQAPLDVWHANRDDVMQAAQKGQPDERD